MRVVAYTSKKRKIIDYTIENTSNPFVAAYQVSQRVFQSPFVKNIPRGMIDRKAQYSYRVYSEKAGTLGYCEVYLDNNGLCVRIAIHEMTGTYDHAIEPWCGKDHLAWVAQRHNLYFYYEKKVRVIDDMTDLIVFVVTARRDDIAYLHAIYVHHAEVQSFLQENTLEVVAIMSNYPMYLVPEGE